VQEMMSDELGEQDEPTRQSATTRRPTVRLVAMRKKRSRVRRGRVRHERQLVFGLLATRNRRPEPLFERHSRHCGNVGCSSRPCFFPSSQTRAAQKIRDALLEGCTAQHSTAHVSNARLLAHQIDRRDRYTPTPLGHSR
jgi:hypothetical protein